MNGGDPVQHALRVLALQQELRTLRRHHTEHTLPLCVAVSEVRSAGDHLQWGLLAGLVLGGGGREFLFNTVYCVYLKIPSLYMYVQLRNRERELGRMS